MTTIDCSTPARIKRLAAMNNARNYLEIGVFTGTTFVAVELPYKVGVDPCFKFDTKQYEAVGTTFCPVTSDEFFAQLAAPGKLSGITSANPGEAVTFDIIFIDGLHTFEQSYKDFENSLAYAHDKTIWIIDDTVPSDPYSALPDQARCNAYREQAGVNSRAWHGDVFKTVFAIHDRHPEMAYCTPMGGNPPDSALESLR